MMCRFVRMRVVGLLVLAAAVFGPQCAAADSQEGCPFPPPASGWEILPDSATTAPDFLARPFVEVRRLVVCEDGIYFIFLSREKGRIRSTCLVYPKPTRELYAKYLHSNTADPVERARELMETTAKAEQSYDTFLTELSGLLGDKYDEGRAVVFDRTHGPRPRISFDYPMVIRWRGQEVSFLALIDVYFRR